MPICQTHQKEMRAGKNGSYYCATPTKDANNQITGWCQYKEYDTSPQIPQTVTAGSKSVLESRVATLEGQVAMLLTLLDQDQELTDDKSLPF